jgi:hypothetical protein
MQQIWGDAMLVQPLSRCVMQPALVACCCCTPAAAVQPAEHTVLACHKPHGAVQQQQLAAASSSSRGMGMMVKLYGRIPTRRGELSCTDVQVCRCFPWLHSSP